MLKQLREQLARERCVSFSLRTRPNASRTKVVSVMADGSVKIDVAAAAQEGKANAELTRFLAEEFGVAVSHVDILAGNSGRRKIVRITA